MKVLVTGHDGYIGSVLVPKLCSAGHEVVGLDCVYFRGSDFLAGTNSIKTLELDVRDVEPDHLKGCDAVVHLAALSNDPMGALKDGWTHDINFSGTMRLAECAKIANVSRFIFSSSCSMYGATGADERVEEASPFNPQSAYAKAKVDVEDALPSLAADNFSPVFMRNATAHGVSPRLRTDIVVNNLVGWAYTTGKIKILSDGSPWRPLVHVEDIVQALQRVLISPREKIHNQAFNIGVNSENLRVRDIADLIQELMPECEIEFAGTGDPDPRSYRVSFDKYLHTFPNEPLTRTVRSGAQELLHSYRQFGLSEADFSGRFVRLKQLQFLIDSGELDETLRFRSA